MSDAVYFKQVDIWEYHAKKANILYVIEKLDGTSFGLKKKYLNNAIPVFIPMAVYNTLRLAERAAQYDIEIQSIPHLI